MKEEIKEFKKVFNKIRLLGYVKAVNNNSSGIGLTFEKLIGKPVDDYPLPDFHNSIEIKTKLAFSTRPIHLFKLTPEGPEFLVTQNILSKYGYNKNGNYKTFNGSIFSNRIKKIGLDYYFSLKIDYKEEKLILLVYNKQSKLIDNTIYWSFEKLENALLRKLKIMALIYVWPTTKNGIKYYKYYKYNIYKYSNFYTFLNLIEKGIISISFSIDIYKNKERYGQMHDHGTSFDINKEDLNKLFHLIL